MWVFLKKLSTLASGSALGQVAAAAAAPILSRIFTPEDYGLSGLVLSIAMMLVFVATLRYEAVIISGKTGTSRANSFAIAVIVTLLVSTALFLVLFLLWELSENGVLPPGTITAIYLFAPVILLLSVAQSRIMPPLLIQFDCYKLVSLGNLINGAFGALAQIGLGLLGMGAIGLLVGRTLGLIVAMIAMVGPVVRSVFVPIARQTRPRRLRQVLWTYRDQAIFLAPAGFLNTAAMQLPVFVIAASFGTAASGAFFFTQSLASAALMVYRKSITSLTAKEAQALRLGRRPMMPFMLKLIALVSVAGLAGAALLFAYAETLLPFVFGDRWGEAGMMAKWLGIFYAASAIQLPATALSTLLKFQRNQLLTQFAQLLAMAAALAIGVRLGDLETTVALIGISTALVYAANLAFVFRLIRRDDRARAGGPLPLGPLAQPGE